MTLGRQRLAIQYSKSTNHFLNDILNFSKIKELLFIKRQYSKSEKTSPRLERYLQHKDHIYRNIKTSHKSEKDKQPSF